MLHGNETTSRFEKHEKPFEQKASHVLESYPRFERGVLWTSISLSYRADTLESVPYILF